MGLDLKKKIYDPSHPDFGSSDIERKKRTALLAEIGSSTLVWQDAICFECERFNTCLDQNKIPIRPPSRCRGYTENKQTKRLRKLGYLPHGEAIGT